MRILKGLVLASMAVVAVVYWAASRPSQELDLSRSSTVANSNVSAGPSIEARQFALRNLEGREVNLSDFKGKPILVNFWATWCPPCVEELPTMLKFAEWADKEIGLVTLAVSVDENQTVVEKFLREKKFWPSRMLPLTILMNPDASIAVSYGSTKYPESYFINKDFKVVRKFIGIQNWTSQEIVKWITENSR